MPTDSSVNTSRRRPDRRVGLPPPGAGRLVGSARERSGAEPGRSSNKRMRRLDRAGWWATRERTGVVSEDIDRSGPFDIEREEAVLARVVDRSVPIQPQRLPKPSPAPAASDDVDHARDLDGEPSAAAGWSFAAGEPSGADGGAGADGHATDDAGESPDPWLEADARSPGEPYPEPASGPATVVAPAGSWGAPRRRAPLPFSMVRRGFEPAEVEAYIAQQEDALAVAVERADTAERQLAEALAQLSAARDRVAELEEQQRAEPPASIQALGDRVAEILDTAWRAAEEMRAEAAGVLERAEAEVAEAVRTAEAEARAKAAEIVAEAERHRRAVLDELAQRRAEHDAEVARLSHERQTAVAELERLQAVLQRVLTPVAASPGGPSAAASASSPGSPPVAGDAGRSGAGPGPG